MFSEDLVERIRHAFLTVGSSKNEDGMIAGVPDTSDLDALLSVAFFASIEREEGEPVSFRLVFYPDADCNTLGKHWANSISFAVPIPLTVRGVVKLSSAFDRNLCALVASRDPGGSFALIGAVFYGRLSGRLDGAHVGYTTRPKVLTLSVTEPGAVTVSHGDCVVGRFDRGSFRLSAGDPLYSPSLSRVLLSTISLHKLADVYEWDYKHLYFSCLRRLYQTASKEGHGGTIVWTPESCLPDVLAKLTRGVRVTSQPEIPGLIGLKLAYEKEAFESRSSPETIRELAKVTRALAERLDVIARLACVDGALVVNERLEVECFSTVLSAPEWAKTVVNGSPVDEEQAAYIDLGRFGTRHRSAVNLVGSCPGTIAFAISEDGPIRALTGASDSVCVWLDCRDALFMA